MISTALFIIILVLNYQGIFDKRTREAYERQAGVLGKTVADEKTMDRMADGLVHGSFQNPTIDGGYTTFSERIWVNQDALWSAVMTELTRGMIWELNPRELTRSLDKKINAGRYNAERLMRTELARVQIGAQQQAISDAGYDSYIFIATSSVAGSISDEEFEKLTGVDSVKMDPAASDKAAKEKITAESKNSTAVAKEEGLRTKKDVPYAVDWKIVKSKEYTERFSKLSDNQKANALAVQRARNALSNRDGRDTEELYAIDLATGKDISKIVDQNYKQGVKRTEKFNLDIARAEAKGAKILFIHNHLGGSPPTIADLNELLNHEEAVGITVGHDGSIYYYTKPKHEIEKRDLTVAYMKNAKYNDFRSNNEVAMEELAQRFDFIFKVF